MDDWYQRRRDDAEGRFFRGVADQSPQKGVGGATRQGTYLLTADGKLLGWKNYNDAHEMREFLLRGLGEWRKLPEERRRPGAVSVEESVAVDSIYARVPPRDGLIVDVSTRQLERGADGSYRKLSVSDRGRDRAARDHLWLTADEARSLVPQRPVVGLQKTVPSAVATRIVRFHLIDNTRGEPPMWKSDEIRSLSLSLTVETVTEAVTTLRLDGAVVLSTRRDPQQSDRGFDVRLLGYLSWDRNKQQFTRFDAVALGDHWGEGRFTGGARSGRTPLGVAFRLSAGTPADRVPPQGAREGTEYFGRK